MINQVGQQIGNYRLVKPLGEGSFAQVWLGEHLHLQAYAALKILTALDPQAQQMFLKEARIIVTTQGGGLEMTKKSTTKHEQLDTCSPLQCPLDCAPVTAVILS